MNMHELMSEIESYEFNARVNVVGSFTNFLDAIREEKPVIELFKSLESSENVVEVFEKMRELANSQPDLRYENKWDVAIAVYLWLISIRDRELGIMGSEIVSRAQQCWWTKKMSSSILSSLDTYNSSKVRIEPYEREVRAVKRSFSVIAKKAGDSLVLMRYMHDEYGPLSIWRIRSRSSASKMRGTVIGVGAF